MSSFATQDERETARAAGTAGADRRASRARPARTEKAESPINNQSIAFDRWLLEKLLRAVGSPKVGVQLWDGYLTGRPMSGQPANSKEAENVIRFHDRAAFYRVLYKPSLTFGELFTEGRVSIRGNLVQTLEEIHQGFARVDGVGGRKRELARRITFRSKKNSVDESRDNIHSHYDLGNDFYKLWLDPAYMQYTCAYYPTHALTLDQAQIAKLELVCRKLALKPGETVVEAGSGWGGLARYLARYHGVKVRSYNISSEQVAYARKRAAEENLTDAIEYIEDDYRNIQGSFDAFVSIGMLEHVGPRNFGELATVVDRCLKDGGRGLIHTIGQTEQRPLNPWIERYIFPGGEPPTLGQMMDIFEPSRMEVIDVDNLRGHYARTLKHWLERFEENADEVEHMFDTAFVRAWRFYLSGSIAGFSRGGLQLFQVAFQRPGSNALPDTRAHLYASGLVPDEVA